MEKFKQIEKGGVCLGHDPLLVSSAIAVPSYIELLGQSLVQNSNIN